jgi:hypothetical protein
MYIASEGVNCFYLARDKDQAYWRAVASTAIKRRVPKLLAS